MQTCWYMISSGMFVISYLHVEACSPLIWLWRDAASIWEEMALINAAAHLPPEEEPIVQRAWWMVWTTKREQT